MRLIVNADDLGMNERVNEAILSFMERGMVTSASILANAPAAAAALRRASEFPACSFGVHLNITEFAPLTDDPGLAPFIGPDGELTHMPLRPALRPSAVRAIANEWAAQVAFVRSHGVEPSHVDSHHHVHTHPYLFPALTRTLRQCGVRRMRISKNVNGPRFAGERPSRLGDDGLGAVHGLWNTGSRNILGARTANGFTSLLEFHEMHRSGAFDQPEWARRDDWIMELMVHPGHPSYRDETELLSSGWLDEVGMPRISYAEL